MEEYIDTEEMSDYMFSELLKKGYNITADEADEIADIMFNYLIHKGFVEEEEK